MNWLSKWCKRLRERMTGPEWPDDPAERRRIKMFLLAAGAGPALRPNDKGVIVIEHKTREEQQGRAR